ncbi:hypothetical protein SAMN04487934_10538 [Eubacterium ruminantium]|nr:hypothetical protein SAMN04487934_10538 [Eubacterium ruminantium]
MKELYKNDIIKVIEESFQAKKITRDDQSLDLEIDRYIDAVEEMQLKLDNAIAEKDNAIAEKDNAIAEKDNAIAEKDNTIATLQARIAKLEAK